MDGTLYYRDRPAPGAQELLNYLRGNGKKVGFITNNSRNTAGEIARKLFGIGIFAQPDEIVTATDAVGSYLMGQYGPLKVKAAGSQSMQQAIAEKGHRIIPLPSAEQADVIVLGRDTDFSFDKLQQIVNDVERGVKLVATNPDLYHPGPGGSKIPETGALARAIEAITGQPVPSIGKPGPYLFECAMNKYGAEARHCTMVGDNLETDIAGGVRAGMRTIWLRSGGMNQTLTGGDASVPIPDVIIERIEQWSYFNKNDEWRSD
ncbi:HAD-IIA family hydrolase [Paenibacillus spongiae]|uniref:HAD-IIA family hydrolase n=1 Tax=Paenibacillus spongiae TaxID=2909671 RepID=A0ABY5S2B4_9BACL|nr:HAD-IIA family hydrolase [Paenibacillus spongiae]UVI28011.1 HAD-IIA family hydrolase [Paenibacillus spongiae]